MNDDVLKEFLVSLGFKVDVVSMKKFTDSVATVTKGVMAAGVAVAATATAIVAGVAVISNQMEKLYYASQRTGETVGNLMALRYAAGQIGLTADQAQGALEGFARTLRLNPGTNNLLTSLGVTGDGPAAKFESFVEQMKKQKPYVAAAYAGLFGIDPDTLLMLENGLPKLEAAQDKYREKLAAFHITPDQAAEAGKDFDNSIRNLADDIHLFWVLLQEHLAPVLSTITEKFTKWEESHADVVAGKIATALEAVANWVAQINWSEVGKDVDIFLTKAWEVAKVIGNIIGAFANVAKFLGGGSSGGGTPSSTDGSTPAQAEQHPGETPFTAWIRRHVDKWRDDFNGTHSSENGGFQADGSIVEVPAANGAPRGIRNNNPGNIRAGSFANHAGATGDDGGGFATFASMQEGTQAAIRLLQSYAARGYDTVKTIISRWAPGSENNTAAYIADVAKKLGVSADAHLSGNQLSTVAQAIFEHENGLASGNGAALMSSARNTRLGGAALSGRSVTVTQKTDIHVNGSADAHGTARAVASEQSRVNGDLVRNFSGVVV
ncbi:hypothetical protein [Caballeronia sp. KNU42]